MAGARAAEFFRDRDAEEAHLGEPLPQGLVIRRLAVEHLAHRFRRALLSEELPRLVAHLFLFVGEIEVHGGLLALMVAHRMGGAKRYPSLFGCG
ncbi:hypothetical protein V1294_007603 [Bradyrhizobium sp. AZCC 1678]